MRREPGQRSQHCGSIPPGQRISRPRLGATCTHKVGHIQITHTHTHTHRVSSTPIATGANTNWETCREREGFYLHLGLVEEAMTVKSFDFLEWWHVWKSGKRLSVAVGVPRQTFSKGRWGALDRDAIHVQLPYKQEERTDGSVCSHSVQLGRLIRKVKTPSFSLLCRQL